MAKTILPGYVVVNAKSGHRKRALWSGRPLVQSSSLIAQPPAASQLARNGARGSLAGSAPGSRLGPDRVSTRRWRTGADSVFARACLGPDDRALSQLQAEPAKRGERRNRWIFLVTIFPPEILNLFSYELVTLLAG